MKALMCKCGEKWQEYAPLILRIVVGLAFLMHGLQKLNEIGVDNFAKGLAGMGVPAAGLFAFVVTWLELLGGIGLILGLWTHWFSKLLAIDMVVAILLVHMGKGFFSSTGGPELPLVLLAACISLMITGAGKFSMDHKWIRQ